jgi:hypothetical protein
MKITPGYASLPARNRVERSIDRNQGLPKSPRLRRVIIACAPAHPAPGALRYSGGSSTHDRALEGSVVWLVLAWMAGRALKTQLYGVGSADAFASTLAPALLLVTALLAGLGPARRAGRVDPAVTLHSD